MEEYLISAFVGAAVALLFRELPEIWKNHKRKKKLAKMCVEHLEQIQNDLNEHVRVNEGRAIFSETEYCEIIVGNFLHDLITNNMDVFPDASSIKKTIMFFHHYKVNMSTIKARMDGAGQQSASVTEPTFRNLQNYLSDAIGELKGLAGT